MPSRHDSFGNGVTIPATTARSSVLDRRRRPERLAGVAGLGRGLPTVLDRLRDPRGGGEEGAAGTLAG